MAKKLLRARKKLSRKYKKYNRAVNDNTSNKIVRKKRKVKKAVAKVKTLSPKPKSIATFKKPSLLKPKIKKTTGKSVTKSKKK